MSLLRDALLEGRNIREIEPLEKHADWAESFMKKYDGFNASNADEIIRNEIGLVFSEVLECAGVYKHTAEGRDALMKFIERIK